MVYTELKFVRKEIKRVQNEQNKLKLQLKKGEDTPQVHQQIKDLYKRLEELELNKQRIIELHFERRIIKSKNSKRKNESKLNYIQKLEYPDRVYCSDGVIRTKRNATIWHSTEGVLFTDKKNAIIKEKNHARLKRYNDFIQNKECC